MDSGTNNLSLQKTFDIGRAPFGRSERYVYTFSGMTQGQFDIAYQDYVDLHGQYNADYNAGHFIDFINEYAQRNNIELTIANDSVIVNRPYPYYYVYTNITDDELNALRSIVRNTNDMENVPPDQLHALVTAFAQEANRNITFIRRAQENRRQTRSRQIRRTRRRRRRNSRRVQQEYATYLLRSNLLNTTYARRIHYGQSRPSNDIRQQGISRTRAERDIVDEIYIREAANSRIQDALAQRMRNTISNHPL